MGLPQHLVCIEALNPASRAPVPAVTSAERRVLDYYTTLATTVMRATTLTSKPIMNKMTWVQLGVAAMLRLVA
jgi:hypothetical protein